MKEYSIIYRNLKNIVLFMELLDRNVEARYQRLEKLDMLFP